MIRLSNILQKQGQYLLQNELYALSFAAVLALTPFATWLSLAVALLVTLRKGSYNGFKVMVVGVSVAVIAATYSMTLPYTTPITIITFLLGYFSALLLRVTASWKAVVGSILGFALFCLMLIHLIAPESIIEQFQSLLAMFREIDKDGSVVRLLDSQYAANKEILANYLLGVKAFSIVFSVFSSLTLARWIQSLLFYPGGFRKELLEFRSSRIGVLLLFLSVVGAYQGHPVAISCLPLLAAYFMASGMSLLFNLMSEKRNVVILIALFVPLILAPYIILLVYIGFGSLDSLFNFRRLLLKKQASSA